MPLVRPSHSDVLTQRKLGHIAYLRQDSSNIISMTRPIILAYRLATMWPRKNAGISLPYHYFVRPIKKPGEYNRALQAFNVSSYKGVDPRNTNNRWHAHDCPGPYISAKNNFHIHAMYHNSWIPRPDNVTQSMVPLQGPELAYFRLIRRTDNEYGGITIQLLVGGITSLYKYWWPHPHSCSV